MLSIVVTIRIIFDFLEPRRVRNRTTHKGVIPCRTGGSTKGTTMQYGDYGLRIIARGRPLSAKQLETADNILRKALKDVKGSRIYYRYACGRAVCKKGNEVFQFHLAELIVGSYGKR
jgi:ribosomal protein L16/L10AE